MSEQKVLIIKGSPRKNGNSSILADRIAEGARESGAQVEVFALQQMDVRPCTACDACIKGKKHECVVQDDMQMLYPKVREADALVLATPVYWFTMSAQLKAFIDRLYALQQPDGSNLLHGKRIAIALAYGDTDPFTSGAVNALRTFQDMFAYIKAPIVGTVYVSASNENDVLEQPDMLEQARALGRKLAVREG